MSHIPKRVRDIVVSRESYCCARCGQWAEGGSLHHRKLRSQGGRHDLSTLVLLCGSGVTGCHGLAHHERDQALAEGFVVRAWEDPAERPVKVYGHGWVLLTASGQYQPCAAPPPEEEVPLAG